MKKDSIVDKVLWHTRVEGNSETPEMVRLRFKTIAIFLQSHGLTLRHLISEDSEPDDDFCIRESDLTHDGSIIMGIPYDKWLRKVANKNKDVSDLSILINAIRDLRNA